MNETHDTGSSGPRPHPPGGSHYAAALTALWIGGLFPAFVTAAQMELNFVLVRQACSAHRNLALYAVTVVAIALNLLASSFAFVVWRRRGTLWPTEAADKTTRTRFIAAWALLGNALFLLLTIAQGIAATFFDPCQL